MENQATAFFGKSQPSKPKTNRKTMEAPKGNAKEPPINRQRRVFGTSQNPNVPAKTVPEKKPMMKKPSIEVCPKQPHPTQTTPAATEAAEKRSPEKNRANIPEKTVAEKPMMKKPSIEVSQKQPQPIQTTPAATVAAEKMPAKTVADNSITKKPSIEASSKQTQPIQTTPTVTEAPEKKSPDKNRASVTAETVAENSTIKRPSIEASPEQPQPTQTTPSATMAAEKIPAKTVAENPMMKKLSIEASPKQPQPTQNTPSAIMAAEKTPAKTVAENPITKKPSIEAFPKQTQPIQTTPATTEAGDKKSPEKNRAGMKKKKSVCFQEQLGKSTTKILQEGDLTGPRTPVAGSPSLAKPRASGTPYQTAERCSKCRFDRLETSSYWLSQIKLAESVGKHFVSAAFFRLALDSKAEPIRSLRVELKRYVARHGCLSAEAEWRHVCLSYGLMMNAGGDANGGTLDQAQENLKEPLMDQLET